jgi:DNA polymerase-3 subunit epsilon
VRLPELRSAPQLLLAKDIDWNARETGAETLYGPFATKAHVKAMLEHLAGEEGLCWRQLGWEKRGGPCFARQVRKCRGACVGEESPEQHNLRLATALAPQRLRDWPWASRMMIVERHPEGRFEEAHVFDRWSHIGTARDESELETLAEARVEIDFDPDIYRILVSYIARHRAAAQPLRRAATAIPA